MMSGQRDHFVPANGSEEYSWLIEQLRRWPERVHQERTTSMSFLMQSAAATLKARLAPAPEIVVTEGQRERALAAGRAIIHGQGDGTYQEATDAIHLLLAALGGLQSAPEQVVREALSLLKRCEGYIEAFCDENKGAASRDAAKLVERIKAALAQPEAARVVVSSAMPCTHQRIQTIMATVGRIGCGDCNWSRQMTPEEFAYWNPSFEERQSAVHSQPEAAR